MWVAVVYESLFGNTRAAAEAIAQGLRSAAPGVAVECSAAGDADPALGRADLLVVGAPTHFLGMPSPRSRRVQQQQAAGGAWHRPADGQPEPPGVREWVHSLPAREDAPQAAVFDTRLGKLMAGSAARQISRSLRRRGYQLTRPAAGFLVEDVGGPLAEGELDRARTWGASLVRQLQAGTAAPA